jgi:hypothetical protein
MKHHYAGFQDGSRAQCARVLEQHRQPSCFLLDVRQLDVLKDVPLVVRQPQRRCILVRSNDASIVDVLDLLHG